MTDARLQTLILIEKAFEERAKITPHTKGEACEAVGSVLHEAKARRKRSQEKGFRTSSDGNFWKITIVRVERAGSSVLKQDRSDVRVGDEVPPHRRFARHMLKRVHESV